MKRNRLLLLTLAVALLLPAAGLAMSLDDLRAAGYLPKGTEITGLRDEDSRHFSNGDGTFTAEVRMADDGSSAEPTGEVDIVCKPDNAQYWTGIVNSAAYTKYDHSGEFPSGYLDWGTLFSTDRSWVKFNTTSIPDGATITSVTLTTWMYDVLGFQNITTIKTIANTVNPVTATGSQIWNAITSGTAVWTGMPPSSGSFTTPNMPAVATLVQAGLAQNYSSLGYMADGLDPMWAYGRDNPAYIPYLTIAYSLPVQDVQVVSIDAPTDTKDWNGTYPVQATVRNNGPGVATFNVKFDISDGYTSTRIVTALGVGSQTTVNFDDWNASTPGSFGTKCSTRLDDDPNQANNRATGTVSVLKLDAAAVSIDAPTGVVYRDVTVAPQATVRNLGSTPQAFDVSFFIGDGSDDYSETQTTSLLDPDEEEPVIFDDWTPASTGTFAVGCSCRLAGDMVNANDSLLGSVTVHYRDVGAEAIVAPSGTYEVGDPVTPSATWHNYGTVSADFEAWMLISDPDDGEVYRHKVDHAGLAPGSDVTISSFPSLNLDPAGTWTARCSTGYAGDQSADNDEHEQEFTVLEPGVFDVAVTAIVAPAGRLDTGAVVVPRGRVKNNSDVAAGCGAWFIINDPTDAEYYREYFAVTGLAIGEEREVSFPACTVSTTQGNWNARCSVYVVNDTGPGNDFLDRGFAVATRPDWPAGWVEVEKLPGSTPVKDGAWLAFDPASKLVYAAKGNKTTEFYAYDPDRDEWTALASIPTGTEGKTPRKGCRGVADGSGHVYMTKGNNTFGFHRYDIVANAWEQLPDVPEGPSRKKVKGGTDLAYVDINDTGWVYLMKGYKTEFYRFNTVSGYWDTLDNLPYGYKEKWDKGSWLASDGAGRLYAHQAKYYNRGTDFHYMYEYDVAAGAWNATALKGMPLWGLHSGRAKKKKAKDGSAGAYFDGWIYALKGGNTQQFFGYDVAEDSWTELDTVPNYSPTTGRKRRVKHGADIVSYGYGYFFALKGNKTVEFWRYGLAEEADGSRPTADGRNGRMAGRIGSWPVSLTVAPNPLIGGHATLRYSLPKAGAATVNVFDVTGRSVLSRSLVATRTGAVSLDMRDLAAGTYLVRLEIEGYSATQKLVLQR